ncbi:MAG TPA: thioredoxin [Rhodothermales bacterium]|nr:thioredoxin [Rhodothermales bacterium]
MSYEVSDFNREVLEASRSRPVLVDFWAPWCGPCRMLSPTLEKLAAEADGKWSLVTVNTDEHQDLSTSYQVRGIPAVKLFSEGEVVAEFTGAMPEYAVKQWLDQQMPSEAGKSLYVARTLIANGRIADAVELLESLGSEPEANLLLASLIVLDDPQRARALVASSAEIDGTVEHIRAAVETVASAIVESAEIDLPDGPGRADYEQAIGKLRSGDVRGAIEKLMNILIKDRYYGDDAARKLGVALFTLLGETHPVTHEYRRTFDMYLY